MIDTGTRRLVLVQVGDGRFELCEVKLGGRGENCIEIIEGVSEGEQVVVAANFLIDAESNLKAVVADLAAQAGGSNAAQGSVDAKVGHRATGTVDGVDARAGTLSLNHDPVPSLKWPAMTMTGVAIRAGLLPIMWGSGTGAEVISRIAATMVGGMISSTVLTLCVMPALYALVKQWQLRAEQRRGAASPAPGPA